MKASLFSISPSIQPQLWLLFFASPQLLNCEAYIRNCIQECWREEPAERPDFRYIRTSLRALQAGL